jgi:ribosomal protein S6--L-glutamate ligase
LRVHFIRTPKPRNAVLEELYRLLGERDVEVSEGIPELALEDLDRAPAHDLYVLKARTSLPISIAGILHHRGARLLNSYASCATLVNKLVATALMRGAEIPTPRSWAAADPSRLDPAELAERLPLIVKPFDGIGSRGISVIRKRAELSALAAASGPVLVQEFVDGCDRRYKLHCVADRVFATWKPFSLGGDPRDGTPCEVSDELRSIAWRTGRLFGLALYGLDVLVGPRGPVVVDVNSFPGYAGVPGAAGAIADYIEQYARRLLAPAPS